jgi:hypothetical protein
MLYLLGGPSRAGKSALARRLLREAGIPYFSLDVLMMGVARGWPAVGVDPDTPAEERAALLWPVIRAIAVDLLEEEAVHPTYLLEGDVLLPRTVAELVSVYPDQVSTCFVGYARGDPVERLRLVRSVDPTWYDYSPDSEVVRFLDEQVTFSAYLEEECARHGLPYVDVSAWGSEGLDEAFRHLVGESPRP